MTPGATYGTRGFSTTLWPWEEILPEGVVATAKTLAKLITDWPAAEPK